MLLAAFCKYWLKVLFFKKIVKKYFCDTHCHSILHHILSTQTMPNLRKIQKKVLKVGMVGEERLMKFFLSDYILK